MFGCGLQLTLAPVKGRSAYMVTLATCAVLSTTNVLTLLASSEVPCLYSALSLCSMQVHHDLATRIYNCPTDYLTLNPKP